MTPEEIDEMLRKYEAGELEAIPQGEDMPPSTRVVFAEPVHERGPLEIPREKVVDAGPLRDIELAAARAQDFASRRDMALERGGRSLLAGLTRTQAAPVEARAVDAVQQLFARRREAEGLRKTNADEAFRGQQLEAATGAREAAAVAAEKRRAEDLALAAQRRKEDLDERAADNERSAAQHAERMRASAESSDATRALANASFAATQRNRGLENEGDLRKEFNALPDVKGFAEVDTSYQKLQGGAKSSSAAGDLVMIFQFMKMLDPGSTVREGEQASAQNAAGVPERIRAQWNALKSGERLTPAQRQDFLRQAESFYAAHKSRYDAQARRYSKLAEGQGTRPEVITGEEPERAQGPNGEIVEWNGKEWVRVK